MLTKTGEQLPAAERTALEAEHGPIVVLSHPDGSRFGFKVLDRDTFTTRNKRVARKDDEADERMLQERCVWPSRAEWNAYVAAGAFEVLAYIKAYKEAHGDATARLCDLADIPEGADPAGIWISNGVDTFNFRKPVRVDVKLFQAAVIAKQRGEALPDAPDPLEALLRSCAKSPEFGPWLDANPFGGAAFGDPFVLASGMGEARAVAK